VRALVLKKNALYTSVFLPLHSIEIEKYSNKGFAGFAFGKIAIGSWK